MSNRIYLSVFVFFSSLSLLQAGDTFNGIPLNQGNNLHGSNVYGGDNPWFTDVRDFFNRDGLLLQSYADELRVGFVPPNEASPADYNLVGRWMGSSDYETSDGAVSRTTANSIGVVCVPWRVTPGLGDFYLIELEADVAEKESVRLGYFGDTSIYDPHAGLLVGDVGQLVVDVTRDGDDLDWIVTWVGANGGDDKPFLSGSIQDVTESIKLELGWNENVNSFDAWISSGDDSFHLAAGGMGHGIEVFGVGFELTGTNSSVTSFLAAVPEPQGVGNFVILALLSLVRIVRKGKK